MGNQGETLYFLRMLFSLSIPSSALALEAHPDAHPGIPTSGHAQDSFRIAAPPPEIHRRRQIAGRLPSEGDTALLLSHFRGFPWGSNMSLMLLSGSCMSHYALHSLLVTSCMSHYALHSLLVTSCSLPCFVINTNSEHTHT